jgi:Predicted transcriptional regulators
MAGGVGHRLDTLQARRELAGLSIGELARRTTLPDAQISRLERGDTCRPDTTQRILDALGSPVAVTSSSVANPSQITCATHGFQTGDSVTIAGHAASTPSINATHIVTRISPTVFSIPVNVTGGGTGGTATLEPASLGIARL